MLSRVIDLKIDADMIISTLGNQRGFIALDSSKKDKYGRYSFFVYEPFETITSRSADLEALTQMDKLLERYEVRQYQLYPFIGGAVGFITYDYGLAVEGLTYLPCASNTHSGMPMLHFGFYHGSLCLDNESGELRYNDYDMDSNAQKRFDELTSILENAVDTSVNTEAVGEFSSSATRETYDENIQRIRDYIEQGDIYQTNYTIRFETISDAPPVHTYLKLRKKNPAPFSAFIKGEGYSILSSSPERFIKVNHRKISTRPIKGTMPRGSNELEDEIISRKLYESEKNRAELLMIVDLERNDLGKICKVGTVKVEELFEVEKYETVLHLVSTVSGELEENAAFSDVIKATFPGGSITGAPKRRAMEIIYELEPTCRGIYTGSIGYVDFNGDIDLNIAIRTIVLDGEKGYFQVGGGITYDSEANDEYDELLSKGKALFEVLS